MTKVFKITKEKYFMTKWFIRQYDDLVAEYMEIVEGSGMQIDGMPRSTRPGDPTGSKAIKAAELSFQIGAIEKGLARIPEEYRAGILGKLARCRPYPETASISTWKRWTQVAIYYIAQERGFL